MSWSFISNVLATAGSLRNVTMPFTPGRQEVFQTRLNLTCFSLVSIFGERADVRADGRA